RTPRAARGCALVPRRPPPDRGQPCLARRCMPIPNPDNRTAAPMKTLLAFALLLITGSSVAAPAPDKPVPSRVEVKYRVSIAGIPIGEGTDVFQHDGKTYSVVSQSNTVGLAAIYRFNMRRE